MNIACYLLASVHHPSRPTSPQMELLCVNILLARVLGLLEIRIFSVEFPNYSALVAVPL